MEVPKCGASAFIHYGEVHQRLRRTLVGIWARVETIVSCPLFHGSAAFGEAFSSQGIDLVLTAKGKGYKTREVLSWTCSTSAPYRTCAYSK